MSNPTPQPVPVPVHRPDWISRVIAIGAVLILVYVQFFPHSKSSQSITGNLDVTIHRELPNPVPDPKPVPSSDLATIGHDFGVTLAGTYADAWESAAKDMDAGKSMDDIETNMLSVWKASRSAALSKDVIPSFEAIVPKDGKPTSETRPKWSKAARDFATGLRSVK